MAAPGSPSPTQGPWISSCPPPRPLPPGLFPTIIVRLPPCTPAHFRTPPLPPWVPLPHILGASRVSACRTVGSVPSALRARPAVPGIPSSISPPAGLARTRTSGHPWVLVLAEEAWLCRLGIAHGIAVAGPHPVVGPAWRVSPVPPAAAGHGLTCRVLGAFREQGARPDDNRHGNWTGTHTRACTRTRLLQQSRHLARMIRSVRFSISAVVYVSAVVHVALYP